MSLEIDGNKEFPRGYPNQRRPISTPRAWVEITAVIGLVLSPFVFFLCK